MNLVKEHKREIRNMAIIGIKMMMTISRKREKALENERIKTE